MTAVGVDGCRGGWFAVEMGTDGHGCGRLYRHVGDLWRHLGARSGLILIDIPIGLPAASPRQCDPEARRLLPRERKSSLFPVPCREAVYAADYAAACTVNHQRLGRRVSRQSWNICPKIREVDRFLAAVPAARRVLRESHPELAFMGLNGGEAMAGNKKTGGGAAERLAVLRRHFLDADALHASALAETPRRLVGGDDVLDAMALAAAAAGTRGLASVPPEPEHDDLGLPMAILVPLPGE